MLASDIRVLFELLPGNWQLDRAIPENRATMTGTAQFERAAEDVAERVLNYRETGIMNYHEVLHEGERRYRYELGADAIFTYFADGPDTGKIFERLMLMPSSSLGPVTLRGDHLCGNDHYDTTYIFADADHFTLVHRVKGPAKNYVSTTRYSRISVHP